MGMITVTKKDMLRAKVVAPGRYRVKVTDVIESLSKKGDSNNFRIEGEIICDEGGDTTFAGVPTPYLWTFNDKASGMMFPFIEAITGQKVEEGMRIRMDKSLVDKELIVRIDNELYQGRIVNSIRQEYASVS